MADASDVEKTGDSDAAVAEDLKPGQEGATESTEAFKTAITAAAQESVAEDTIGQALEGASNTFANGIAQFEEEKVKRGADPDHVRDVVARGGENVRDVVGVTLNQTVSAAVSAAGSK